MASTADWKSPRPRWRSVNRRRGAEAAEPVEVEPGAEVAARAGEDDQPARCRPRPSPSRCAASSAREVGRERVAPRAGRLSVSRWTGPSADSAEQRHRIHAATARASAGAELDRRDRHAHHVEAVVHVDHAAGDGRGRAGCRGTPRCGPRRRRRSGAGAASWRRRTRSSCR